MSILQEISAEQFDQILSGSRKNTRIRQIVFPPEARDFGSAAGKNLHPLDTLNYLPTKIAKRPKTQSVDNLTPLRALAGNSVKESSEKPATEYKKGDLSKRANNLYFSRAYKTGLITHNPGSVLIEKYNNSIKCGTTIKKIAEGITSRYCGARWCNVCNRIATGKAINKHGRKVSELLDPYFCTLTIPNVPAATLEGAVKEMSRTFAKIIQAYQLKQRRKGAPIAPGLRKIEITYNPGNLSFHPHIHVIIDTEAAANYVRRAWLKHNKDASHKAQDVRPATIGAAFELFKYVTKMLPDKAPGQTWKDYFTDDDRVKLFFQQQDVIYTSIQGVRTFQTFGFEKIDTEAEIVVIEGDESDQGAEDLENLQKLDQYEGTESAEAGRYIWIDSAQNWINHDTGEQLLENYKPPPRLVNLIDLIIGNKPEKTEF